MRPLKRALRSFKSKILHATSNKDGSKVPRGLYAQCSEKEKGEKKKLASKD